MLSKRRGEQDGIAILFVDRYCIGRPDVWFSDGNAANKDTTFYNSPLQLRKLDWRCIQSSDWRKHRDGKRIACAEVLVPDRVPIKDILEAVVRTCEAADRVRRLFPTLAVTANSGYFF